MSERIGITLGDPAGIGPEITAKAISVLPESWNDLVLIGNRDNFSYVLKNAGISEGIMGRVEFIDISAKEFELGKISFEAGSVAMRSIEKAASMAMENRLAGICTAPINKEAILMAGAIHKDHTDMLKHITSSENVSTVFETLGLRILFLSKHVSMKDALELITTDSVYRSIEQADYALRMLGLNERRMAVAARTPHGGENGLFGREGIYIIAPAIAKAREKYNVDGPFPADSIFHRAAHGGFDMVVSLFHDQGHIAAKMYDFNRTVSMNIGLPFLRTSVDHGTALDIAGKWVADENSMLEAIRKAIQYSGSYRQNYLEDLKTR